jgi:hypothetical protein
MDWKERIDAWLQKGPVLSLAAALFAGGATIENWAFRSLGGLRSRCGPEGLEIVYAVKRELAFGGLLLASLVLIATVAACIRREGPWIALALASSGWVLLWFVMVSA